MHHGLSIRSSLISTTLTMSLTMRFRKCMFMYQVWPIHPRKIINIVCVCFRYADTSGAANDVYEFVRTSESPPCFS